MKKFVRKISDNRNRILTVAAAATVVGVAALYFRDRGVQVTDDLILTASDVARLNEGKMALIFESHGSELAIVPARLLKK